MMPLLIGGADRSATARSRAEELLAAVGLAGRMSHRPSRAVGRRAAARAVARALVHDPAGRAGRRAVGQSRSCQQRAAARAVLPLAREFETAVIVVTHNRQLAGRADRVLSLEDGRLVRPTRRGVDALMLCDHCREREAVINLTQIVNDQVTTLHLCERVRRGEGGGEPGRGVRKSPLADFLAADGQGNRTERWRPRTGDSCPSLRRDAAGLPGDRPARLRRVLSRPSRHTCATCCAASTARPSTWASAMPIRQRRAGRPPRARPSTCGSSSGGRWRPRTSSWPPSCATASGCWNDRPAACSPTAAWAGSMRSGPSRRPRAVHPDPTGAEPRRAGVPGPQLASASGRRSSLGGARRRGDTRAAPAAPSRFRLDRLERHRPPAPARAAPGEQGAGGAGADGRSRLGRRRCWCTDRVGVMVNEEDHLRLQGAPFRASRWRTPTPRSTGWTTNWGADFRSRFTVSSAILRPVRQTSGPGSGRRVLDPLAGPRARPRKSGRFSRGWRRSG